MRKTTNSPAEKIVKDIKRATRKLYSSEEKIRIVLDGLRGEDRIAELCGPSTKRNGRSRLSYLRAPRLRPSLKPPNDGTQMESNLDLRVALINGAGQSHGEFL